MKQYHRVCASVNLDAFDENLDAICRLIAPGARVCAVIKADGYGHGAVALAQVMEEREEIWGYAVATVEEAMVLRRFSMKKPILILGYVFDEDLDPLIGADIRPTVFSLEMAEELSRDAAKRGKCVPVHIKLDTGMGRIGFPCTMQSVEEIAAIAQLPNLAIEGIFTHFARADEADKSYADAQYQRFARMIADLRDRGVEIPLHHASNSAGVVDLPEYHENLVRAGIILYGLWPSAEVKKQRLALRPLLTLRSHVVHVKTLLPGQSISYGGTYVCDKARRIATIPVGYGDGYPRSLSNRGYVLIHGKKAPIRGRVCMDQFMVDVSEIEDVVPGDEVILVGESGGERITVEELGELSGRFNYEFVCSLSKRIPRVYFRDGKPLAEHSYFEK